MKELDPLTLAALAVLGWLVLSRSRGRRAAPPPPPPPHLPPPPPPPDDRSFVNKGVDVYDQVTDKVSYDLCISQGGNPQACRVGTDVLKYANPITASVHVGEAIYDWALG